MTSEVITESKVCIHAMTDVGKARTLNEDNFVVCPDIGEKRWFVSDQPVHLSPNGCLLVVADGMGGANAGEVASEIAVEAVRKKFDKLILAEDLDDSQAQDYLYQAIIEAHKAILAAAIDNPAYEGMGTTILIVWVFAGKAVLGWCGDSRAYLYQRNGGLKLLTKDHSLVWELVEAGQLTLEEADVHPDSNIITQSLGDKKRTPRPDFAVSRLEGGDRLLLCSDGLNNMVTHKAIGATLGEDGSLAVVNQKLIELANEQGGDDNITVVSLEVFKEQTEEKSHRAVWLILLIAVCCLAGWLYLSRDLSGTSATGFRKQPEVVSKQAEAVTKPVEAVPNHEPVVNELEPEESTPAANENSVSKAPFATAAQVATAAQTEKQADEYAPALRLVLAKYNYLDSIISLRIVSELQIVSDQDSSQLSLDTIHLAGEQIVDDVEKEEKKELNNLVLRYQLGLAKMDNAQQVLLDSLSANDKLRLDRVAKELSRIEFLMNQVKTH